MSAGTIELARCEEFKYVFEFTRVEKNTSFLRAKNILPVCARANKLVHCTVMIIYRAHTPTRISDSSKTVSTKSTATFNT